MGWSFMPHGKARQSREEMVRQGDAREPRAHPRQGRVQPTQSRRHRPLAEALGRAQPGAQVLALPVGDVDADLYANRGGKGLSASRLKTLEAAKGELRRLFGKQKA